jgi:hypothetical protein
VLRFTRAWLWHMVAEFLFSDGNRNTTSWLVLLILCLEWEAIATYSWGSAALAWLYRSLCDGVSRSGPSSNLRGCAYLLQIWLWERFWVTRPYRHDPQVCAQFFLLYIFYVNYLTNNLEFNLQPWPFDDNNAASRPLLGYQWLKITHLIGTVEACYITYSNAFDCITFRQVRQHLFTCRIFSNINKC